MKKPKPFKVYFAGSMNIWSIIQGLIAEAGKRGFEVTYDWTPEGSGEISPPSPEDIWKNDSNGVEQAEVVIFTLHPDHPKTSFGATAQAFYALGLGKHVIFVDMVGDAHPFIQGGCFPIKCSSIESMWDVLESIRHQRDNKTVVRI